MDTTKQLPEHHEIDPALRRLSQVNARIGQLEHLLGSVKDMREELKALRKEKKELLEGQRSKNGPRARSLSVDERTTLAAAVYSVLWRQVCLARDRPSLGIYLRRTEVIAAVRNLDVPFTKTAFDDAWKDMVNSHHLDSTGNGSKTKWCLTDAGQSIAKNIKLGKDIADQLHGDAIAAYTAPSNGNGHNGHEHPSVEVARTAASLAKAYEVNETPEWTSLVAQMMTELTKDDALDIGTIRDKAEATIRSFRAAQLRDEHGISSQEWEEWESLAEESLGVNTSPDEIWEYLMNMVKAYPHINKSHTADSKVKSKKARART